MEAALLIRYNKRIGFIQAVERMKDLEEKDVSGETLLVQAFKYDR